MEHTYSTRKPYAILMKGRPDEADSHQSIGVYDADELRVYRARGWKPAREFMEMVDRARRKDA